MGPRGSPVGRRIFLGMVGLGGAGVLWGSKLAERFNRLVAPVAAMDQTGLTSLLPASGGFRIYSVVGLPPDPSEADYRLTVTGMVARPLALTLAELRALPATRLVRDFQCVTGWRVPDVPWTGVRLSQVLDAAGVAPGAGAVTFHSFDGVYTESLSLDQARRDDVLVAYEMYDEKVSRAHGGPVRLYVAPMYGYKSCKWMGGIEVTGRPQHEGYWQRRGYDLDAWIGRSNGRDDEPV